MRLRAGLVLTITAAVVVAATGCGEDATTTTPTPDVSTLDSGNYAAVPRDAETTRTALSGPLLEAARIGSAIPLILEVDGKFSFQRLPSVDRRVAAGMQPALWSLSPPEFTELAQGLVTGWETSAERREQSFLGRQVDLQILRMSDGAAAETAGRRLAERQAQNLPGAPVSIPGFTGATAKWSPDKKFLDAWLADGSMLLHAHLDDPLSEPADPTPSIEIARQTFARVVEGLKAYSPTPVDQFGSLPIDVDGILGRTLPLEDSQRRKGYDQSMVLSAHAALHLEIHPAQTSAAFTDAGVDVVAYSAARVYRARDAAGRVRLEAALIAENADGWRAIDSPPGLAEVTCFDTADKKHPSGRYPPVCFVPYDNYLGRVTGTNIQELHQKAAAQYRLLAYR